MDTFTTCAFIVIIHYLCSLHNSDDEIPVGHCVFSGKTRAKKISLYV
jgi:hypothetical protein